MKLFDFGYESLINYTNLAPTKFRVMLMRQQHCRVHRLLGELCETRKSASREVMKLLFGRQDYCHVFFERNWIWNYSDSLRLQVSKRGLSVELKQGMEFAQALKEWNAFYRDFCKRAKALAVHLTDAQIRAALDEGGAERQRVEAMLQGSFAPSNVRYT